MLNLSKNGIKLLSTHSVVGIEPVWIFSQIFIQSVKLTKIITHLIYRVYPIPSIIFFPSKKQAVQLLPFFSPIHNNNKNGVYIYIYRNASKCYIAEFTRSVEPLKYISIYLYVLSIGKTNSSAISCNTNSSAQPVWTWKISLQNKNRAIKRGLERKNCAVKNCSEFAMKNAPCVNRTIEIALERIQCDIAANSRRQNRSEFALCVSRH